MNHKARLEIIENCFARIVLGSSSDTDMLKVHAYETRYKCPSTLVTFAGIISEHTGLKFPANVL